VQSPGGSGDRVTGATQTRNRQCGECSLCCTVLRVDEIAKLGGTRCQHVRDGGGCGIHAQRPGICRAYECLWLRGKLRDGDRPDRLGAVLDLVPTGGALRLSIRQASPNLFDNSPRLQQIAAEFREHTPVRVTDVSAVLDPDHPFRVLLANGVEQRVEGDTIVTLHGGVEVTTTRMHWPERLARRAALWWRGFQLRRTGSR
jgi:hypothetical protein